VAVNRSVISTVRPEYGEWARTAFRESGHTGANRALTDIMIAMTTSGYLVRLPAVALVAVLAGAGLTGCKVSYDATADSSASASKGVQSKPPAAPKAKKPAGNEPAAKAPTGSALAALKTIPQKGRAPSTGYSRAQFGTAWTDTDHNGCDQRNDVLRRDLSAQTLKPKTRGCVVLTGTLIDPYTGATIAFQKPKASAVQIDHLVALQNAWVTGAFAWSKEKRTALATDPLNLLAVDGPTNSSKGAGDAATWLPPRKPFRCAYVARQVAVKVKYGAWMTPAEHKAVEKVLAGCPEQKLPQVKPIPAGESSPAGAKPGTKAGAEVNAGSYCPSAGAKGVSEAGTAMVCSAKSGDRPRWRSATS
jgi:uncharacterized protein DUF1524